MKVTHEGFCPCGRKFYLLDDPYGVGHDEPMCEPFRQLEPTEYLRYVRATLVQITDN